MHTINEAYNYLLQAIYCMRIYTLIGSISYEKLVAGHKTAALALACLVAAIVVHHVDEPNDSVGEWQYGHVSNL